MTGDLLMESPTDPLTQLEWGELSERTWAELVDRGLPGHLADLGIDLGERNERRIRLYTLPMVRAGITSLIVPFVSEDGILLDPSLLEQAGGMATEVARGIAYMLFPAWDDPSPEMYPEMNAFAMSVGPMLLRREPRSVNETEPLVALALSDVPRK
jgi:hypothetical protein